MQSACSSKLICSWMRSEVLLHGNFHHWDNRETFLRTLPADKHHTTMRSRMRASCTSHTSLTERQATRLHSALTPMSPDRRTRRRTHVDHAIHGLHRGQRVARVKTEGKKQEERTRQERNLSQGRRKVTERSPTFRKHASQAEHGLAVVRTCASYQGTRTRDRPPLRHDIGQATVEVQVKKTSQYTCGRGVVARQSSGWSPAGFRVGGVAGGGEGRGGPHVSPFLGDGIFSRLMALPRETERRRVHLWRRAFSCK